MRITFLCLGVGFVLLSIACGGSSSPTSSVSSPATPRPSASPMSSSSSSAEADAPPPITKPTPPAERQPQLSRPAQAYLDAMLSGRSIPTLDPASMSIRQVGYIKSPVRIQQVIDRSTCLAESRDQWFLLRGVSMANAVDDKVVSISSFLVAVTGTQQYTTVLGATKTVYVVEAVDTTEADALLAKETERRAEIAERDRIEREAQERAEKQRIAAELKEAKTRTWNTANGKFSVEAEFISKAGNQVKLRRTDNGKEITIPSDKLSQADLDWLAEWAAKRAQ